MILKRLIIDYMMQKKGLLFVDTLRNSRYRDVFYCVDVDTNQYSFWRWQMWHKPVIICDNLDKMDAAFKLSIMGG